MVGCLRVLRQAFLGVVCTAVVGAVAPLTIGVQLTTTTALIMGGTGHPLVGESPDFVGQFVRGALDNYIAPTGLARAEATDPGFYHLVAVHTPEQFWPVFGADLFDTSVAAGVGNLNNCLQGRTSCQAHSFDDDTASSSGYTVFGYSQSARIATIEKRNLLAQYRKPDGTWLPVADSNGVDLDASFVLIGNPNRPNGGIMERFTGLHIPVLGVTFDGATPTDSCDADGTNCRFPTADIAWQYDGWADFPRRPLNLLADLNALAGIIYEHPNYTVSVTGAINQGTTGDTTYYLLPAARLPLLMPLARLGVPAPILDVLDAPLRVIVEWGYDRGVNAGDPTSATLLDSGDPLTKIRNLLTAIPTGLDDGLQDVGFGRPLGTKPAGTFGVGVAMPPTATPSTPASSTPAPATRRPAVRPDGAAGLKPRSRSGLSHPSRGYVGAHGQVDHRNIVGHSRSGRGR
ncbi:PE-PPE domain-containing protein [Mycobacterium sp. RTGN5]|uniref:PE-PPE domain-containing protein n=1 Tax=Mycobacterium sp. RTGN5 TaxID=3016522 RepID=UPI0029C65A7E|nr:PE-PPE domain-containing protein [Mycobacterium sp. RTGN5]